MRCSDAEHGPWCALVTLRAAGLGRRFHLMCENQWHSAKRNLGGRMRQVIATNDGPKAIGPYSQAIKANGLVFLSGQIPLDPATQQLVAGDVAAQTERVLQNITGILTAAGSSLAQVVKTTVFLKSMNDFAAMNEVYARHFTAEPPARSTVEVPRL